MHHLHKKQNNLRGNLTPNLLNQLEKLREENNPNGPGRELALLAKLQQKPSALTAD